MACDNEGQPEVWTTSIKLAKEEAKVEIKEEKKISKLHRFKKGLLGD